MAQVVGIRGMFLGLIPYMREFVIKALESSRILQIVVKQFGIRVTRTDEFGNLTTEGYCESIDTTHFSMNAFKALVEGSDDKVHYVDVPYTEFDVGAMSLPAGDYRVMFEWKKTNFEEGNVDFTNGDATVVGHGTKFTEIFAPNMYVVLTNSALGNNGKYQIDTITDDDHLELKAAFSGTTETGVSFSVGAHFPDPLVHPATDAGYQCFENDIYNIIIRTSDPGAHEYWLTNFVWSGTQFTTFGTDKRDTNILEFFNPKNVLDVFRIPEIPASKTTSGTFDVDRIPQLPFTKETYTIVLFDAASVAADTAGASPVYIEWTEDSGSEVIKIKGKFIYRTGMKYLILRARLKAMTGGTGHCRIGITGVGSASIEFSNTTYQDYEKQYDISALGLVNDTVYEWTIDLKITSTYTAWLTEPLVTIEEAY